MSDDEEWDDPPLLCHCPADVPTGSLASCTIACQQLGAALDLALEEGGRAAKASMPGRGNYRKDACNER